MDDTTLAIPASEEAATPADGVTGADSSLSHLGYTWVCPPLIQCKGLFLLAAARDMPDPTFCISTIMYAPCCCTILSVACISAVCFHKLCFKLLRCKA